MRTENIVKRFSIVCLLSVLFVSLVTAATPINTSTSVSTYKPSSGDAVEMLDMLQLRYSKLDTGLMIVKNNPQGGLSRLYLKNSAPKKETLHKQAVEIMEFTSGLISTTDSISNAIHDYIESNISKNLAMKIIDIRRQAYKIEYDILNQVRNTLSKITRARNTIEIKLIMDQHKHQAKKIGLVFGLLIKEFEEYKRILASKGL